MQAPRKWSPAALAANATAGEAFVANVRAACEQIAANSSGAAAGRNPEYLHQLRVAIRRLRSTLRAFSELVRRRRARRLDRALRSAQRSLGAARDWDVFHDRHRHAGLRRHARRSAAHAQLLARATVASARFRALPVSVLAWAESAPWKSGADAQEPVARLARRALDRLRRSLIEVAEEIDWREPAARHRARIRVKRLRYACDCFAAAWTRSAMRPFLKRLQRLQEILGQMNDIEVQRRLLQELAGGNGHAAARAGAQGLLRKRERALARPLARAWQAFEALRPYWKRRKAARVKG